MAKIVSINEWRHELRDINDPEVLTTFNFLVKNHILEDKSGELTKEKKSNVPALIYDLRKAAECHRIVRKDIQSFIQPGVKLLDICNRIEKNIVKILGRNDLHAGIAFPTGCSINNCFCHDSSNPNDTRILSYNDICKIDFGVHINGYIIDSAFSVAFNPQYDNLLKASKEATMTGIKMSGPDAYIYDISKAIHEVIESYEVTIDGKTYPVKSINQIGGHNILRYIIHGGKLILCAPCESKEYKEQRMYSGEQYAIETFASTGPGNMFKSKSKISNHYMLNKDNDVPYKGKLKTVNYVYNWIKKNRSTLAFCPRWLEDNKIRGVNLSLNELSSKCDPPIIVEYPPLEDIEGSYTSQYEHTIYIHEYGTEILSYGDDY